MNGKKNLTPRERAIRAARRTILRALGGNRMLDGSEEIRIYFKDGVGLSGDDVEGIFSGLPEKTWETKTFYWELEEDKSGGGRLGVEIWMRCA